MNNCTLSDCSTKPRTGLDEPPMQDHLPQCESIRGIAILLVFSFHYIGSLRGYNPYPELPTGMGLLYGGNTGVTLFFLLSGFLLTRPFFQGVPTRYGSYFIRRALRILPMYYFAVLIGLFINYQWAAAFKSLFFYDITLTTLWPMGSVWWSLVVEVQFYLLLPLLLWLASRHNLRLLLIPLLLIAIYGYMQIRSAAPTDMNELRSSILGRWPTFLLGAALAWLQVAQYERIRRLVIGSPWVGPALIVISISVLNILCGHRVRTLGWLAHVYWYDHYLFESLAWSVFMFAVLNFRFAGAALFVNPLLHRIGLWSYSLYLLHSAVIYYVMKVFKAQIPTSTLDVIAYGIGLLLLAAILSSVTFNLIEKPFLRLKPKNVFQLKQAHCQT